MAISLGDIKTWFDNIATNIIKGIANGVRWVKQQIAYYEGQIINSIAKAADNPWKMLGTILMSTLMVALLRAFWQGIKSNAIVNAVLTFIGKIYTTITAILNVIQVPLILLAISISDKLIESFHGQLAVLYEELTSLAELLEKDTSYITAFAEVNRSILYAAYAIVPNGYLEAETKYAEGMISWLGGLKDRLGSYKADPSQVFLDMAVTIASSNAKDANDKTKALWAGMTLASEWIASKGTAIIKSVDGIFTALDSLPDEIRESMRPWFDELNARYEDFKSNYWEPFIEKYKIAKNETDEVLSAYGLSIEDIQGRIKTPADFMMLIGLMSEKERAKQYEMLNLLDSAKTQYKRSYMSPVMMELVGDINKDLFEAVKKHRLELDKDTYEEAEIELSVVQPLDAATWFVGEGGEYKYSAGGMNADGESWFVGE